MRSWLYLCLWSYVDVFLRAVHQPNTPLSANNYVKQRCLDVCMCRSDETKGATGKIYIAYGSLTHIPASQFVFVRLSWCFIAGNQEEAVTPSISLMTLSNFAFCETLTETNWVSVCVSNVCVCNAYRESVINYHRNDCCHYHLLCMTMNALCARKMEECERCVLCVECDDG